MGGWRAGVELEGRQRKEKGATEVEAGRHSKGGAARGRRAQRKDGEPVA
jgi:hypothetical protein